MGTGPVVLLQAITQHYSVSLVVLKYGFKILGVIVNVDSGYVQHASASLTHSARQATAGATCVGPGTGTDRVELKQVRKIALDQGWRVERTGRDHLCFIPPDLARPKVYMGSTPSDRRSVRNLIAKLRREGLIIPHE